MSTATLDVDWTAAAVCAQGMPDYWHAFDNRDRCSAMALCRTCPVRADCHTERERLLDGGHRLYGVWAGDDYGMKNGHQRVKAPVTPDHGTEAGARQHYRMGERPCESCRQAMNLANRTRGRGVTT